MPTPDQNSTTTTTVSGTWASLGFKKPAGWTCDKCLTTNKADAVKCAACEADNPTLSVGSTTSKAGAPFSFTPDSGMRQNESTSGKPAFTFGTIDSKTAVIEKTAVSTTPAFSGFSFNSVNSSGKSNSIELANSGFETEKLDTTSAFSVGKNSSKTSASAKVPPNPSNASASSEAKESPKSLFSFGTASTGFTFGSSKLNQVTASASAVTEFGATSSLKSDQNSASKSAFFGTKDAGAGVQSTVSTGFTFGGASETAAITQASQDVAPAPNQIQARAEETDGVEEEEQLESKRLMFGAGEEDEGIHWNPYPSESLVTEPQVKLYLFDKEYKNQGVGELRIKRNTKTGKSRILIRTDTTGRVILNSALVSGISYEKVLRIFLNYL